MLEPVSYSTPAKLDYRMGIYKVQVNGMDAYGHSGFWGTQVLYIPGMDLYLAANYSGGWGGGAVAPIFGKVLMAMGKMESKNMLVDHPCTTNPFVAQKR